jgi:hypothetical protein
MDIRDSMKKFLTLIAIVSVGLGSCERHPVSQLPKEEAGEAKKDTAKSDESKSTESTPSPVGTPKTYFPRSSQ